MKICSLRNEHFLSRCVYSDILNRKFPQKKPFRLARNAWRFRNCLNHLVAVVYFHSRLLLDFRTVFVKIKLLSLLYYWITYSFIRGDEKFRFSKYYVTGSPVFSINFTNQSIKDSQAILKFFIDLKSSVWFTLVSDFRSIKYFRIAWLFPIDIRYFGLAGINRLVKFIENTGLPGIL